MRPARLSYLLIIALLACSGHENSFMPGSTDKDQPQPDDEYSLPLVNGTAVYVNSFEADEDTVGWRGYGTIQLRNEAPAEGGERSVYVSGGCLVPHADIELEPLDQDSRLVLQCWGKNLAIGGTVSLGSSEFADYITVSVQDTAWAFYQSSDTLFVSANKSLMLSMSSGGIVASAMLVDLIIIIKLEE